MTLEFLFYPKLFKAYPRVDSNSNGADRRLPTKNSRRMGFSMRRLLSFC